MAGKGPRIVIVGGGLSGITMAIEIKKRLHSENFTIYEKNDAPGGTWRDNTYPECACDVPSHWYSLSTEPNPYWTKRYSPQPEIQKYWVGLHKKHNLGSHTVYDSNFKSAIWNAQRQLYEITFERQSNKEETFRVECEVLVSAIGGFSTPLDKPDSLKGLENFHGEVFHSARWRHDIDLKNKRVAVVGNGCSAAQFIPAIAQEPSTHVINFSRSPAWFWPRTDQHDYSGLMKFIFAHVPFVMKAHRAIIAGVGDGTFLQWRLDMPAVRHYAETISARHIRNTAPAKYHEFLVPKYPFGCKRIIRDPGYLASLNQSNVELEIDGIETINEKGVHTKSGREIEFDVLILATGFDVSARGLGINVTGSHGKTVTQQWEEQKGPQAYLGTTIAGFPNFYTILGPNVATGHASVIASTESQVNYIIEMVKAQTRYGVTSFELKTDAEDRYNNDLHSRVNKTVWAGSCKSYYKITHADGSEKVIATYPGTSISYWWKTRTPNWEHYMQKGGSAPVALMKRLASFGKLVAFVLAILAVRRYGYDRLRNEALIFALQRYSQVRQLLRR